MFGKKKKEPKVEQIFASSEDEKSTAATGENVSENDLELAAGENPENKSKNDNAKDKISSKQVEKQEKLDKVKDKISKILQSSNVEIVDENFDDDYETDSTDDETKKQQDYDELKALFGDNKNRKKELTLTIDEFDYTYVGQYVDEYDLQHSKSIKKIKLHKKHSKAFKRIAIAASVFIVLGLGGFLTYFFTRVPPVYLMDVTLSQTEDTYYVSQTLDYTGLYFDLKYSNGKHERVKVDSSYLVRATGYFNEESGRMTASGRADILFAYKEFKLTYTVYIKQKVIAEKDPISVDFGKKLFNMTENDSHIINDRILQVYVNFVGIGKELLNYSQFALQVDVKGDGKYVDCDLTSNGFKLPNGVTETSSDTKYKVIYHISETQTIEFEISL